MRPAALLLSHLASLKGFVHLQRLRAVCDATVALIGGRATVTGIGRCLDRNARRKHLIKAADRLVGNIKLHAELLQFYFALCLKTLPQGDERPLLLIDWTDIGKHWAALVVTLVSDGRGVVIYSHVVARRFENSPRLERQCLKQLSSFPGLVRPIVVGDAGFRCPWMRSVLATSGWDFVARVRGRVQAQFAGDTSWRKLKEVWPQASARAKCLGWSLLARYKPVSARLVVFHQRRHGKKKLPQIGRRKKKHVRGAREPWVLATSLESATAKEVVAIYKKRMQIEETFRDAKCARFGWGLDQTQSRSAKRVSVLLLLAALAHYLSLVIGRAAEDANLHRAFQANTVTTRRVLSLPRLAREIVSALSTSTISALLRAALPPNVLTSHCS